MSISPIAFMWREVSSTSALPGRLPGQARAAAARDDRHVEPPGDRDRGGDVVGVAREGHHSGSRAYMLASLA